MDTIVLIAGNGDVVCERCLVADTAAARIVGLLRRRYLVPGDGVLLSPAWAIHTFFMRFTIDAVFLDEDWSVLAVSEHLRPFRAAWKHGARFVLELAAGEARGLGIVPGTRLAWGKSNLALAL